MKKQISAAALVIMLAAVLFTSCSTTIYTTIQRPAELDLNGAETIAVLPFQVSEGSSNNSQTFMILGDIINFFNNIENSANGSWDCADYLTRGLEQEIAASNFLTLINSEAVRGALNAGKQAPCDVYLTANISRFETEVKQVKRKVKVNGVDQQIPYFYREVSFVLTYQIVDSATNRIISSRSDEVYNKSDEEEDPELLPNTFNTIKPMLKEIVETIMRKIQPYTVTKAITLLKDKSDDPDMETADKYVKNGLLDAAYTLYRKLYETRGYFEAGYNAAIILEAQGNLDAAYEEMQALAMRSGDSRAISALNDIQYEISSQKTLQAQLDK